MATPGRQVTVAFNPQRGTVSFNPPKAKIQSGYHSRGQDLALPRMGRSQQQTALGTTGRYNHMASVFRQYTDDGLPGMARSSGIPYPIPPPATTVDYSSFNMHSE